MSSSASVKHLVIHVVHMTDTPAPQSRQQLRVNHAAATVCDRHELSGDCTASQSISGAVARADARDATHLPGRLLVTSQHD